jgi:hypothetical protein
MSEKSPGGMAIGWTYFASVMMVLIGCWQVFAGIVALVNDSFYVATPKFLLQFDVTTWGWIHLILGAIVLITGAGLFFYATWARVIGVIVVAVSALAMFAWLPYYPVWAIMIIAADVFVIWALTAGGKEVKASQGM